MIQDEFDFLPESRDTPDNSQILVDLDPATLTLDKVYPSPPHPEHSQKTRPAPPAVPPPPKFKHPSVRNSTIPTTDNSKWVHELFQK